VHEKLNTNKEIGKLKNYLIHHSYTDYFSYKEKMIRFGKLKANEEFIKGTKTPFCTFLPSPLLPIPNSIYSEIWNSRWKKRCDHLLFKCLKCLYPFSRIKKNKCEKLSFPEF
jgi:hypothetical protein